MSLNLNQTVLMSGTDFFSDEFAINAYMDSRVPVDTQAAKTEHATIRAALESAGIKVIKVEPPAACQDGVYTANWALCRDDKAVVSKLPNKRSGEEAYAEQTLAGLGKQIMRLPDGLRFSGQGDALPCGNHLFMGSNYRTDWQAHKHIANLLGYEVLSLQTIPERKWHGFGPRVINATTGWPDSFYYDIDLALSVLRAPEGKDKGLIAWCPQAFTRQSRAILRDFNDVEKIEVTPAEATQGFGCNLVSTGETVIMSDRAPKLKSALEARGFKVITPAITELAKGGGFIRCTTLTLDNE